MNRWAAMLGDLPAELQRAIARSQRISLPRGCDAAERLRRLRQALCHADSVRAVYSLLTPDERAMIFALRQMNSGISKDELVRRYGSLRPVAQLAAAPRAESLTERLVLLGWLLPRPARSGRAPRFLLPPELRAWLPQPLPAANDTADPITTTLPQAQRAATALIALCAVHPLAACADGSLRRASAQILAQHLPASADEIAAIARFLLPLLAELGLLARHAGGWAATPAATRFLTLTLAEQGERLREAWFRSPTHDAWLRSIVSDRSGIAWPLLRRRLWDWGAVLPVDQPSDPATLYDRLAAAFGPLSDTHTHGFRTVERTPWQRSRSVAVFQAALHGPLRWFGVVDVQPGTTPGCWRYVRRPTLTSTPASWCYAAPGIVGIPHLSADADLLGLIPFARWHAADATATFYQMTPATLAAARSRGEVEENLWALLARRCGPPPDAWRAGLAQAEPPIRVLYGAVMLADPPAILDRAAKDRSVRRQIAEHLAPGVAFVEPHAVGALLRALGRRGITAEQHGQLPAPTPAELSASESATLLLSCAFYRRHAPPEAPLLPHSGLEDRLRAALTPQLRAALDAALDQLDAQIDHGAPDQPEIVAAPEPPLTPDAARRALAAAIARGRAVELIYDTAGQGTWSRRIVRPLAIEPRGDLWYLRAYCTLRQAERTFRIDRIGAARTVGRGEQY